MSDYIIRMICEAQGKDSLNLKVNWEKYFFQKTNQDIIMNLDKYASFLCGFMPYNVGFIL